MKVGNIGCLILCGLLLLTSCEKSGLDDLPADEAEFYLEGQLQGQTFNYKAGFSDYYQYTNLRSKSGGIVHEGYLQPNCDEEFCGPGVMIAIHNNNGADLSDLLQNGPAYYFDNFGIPGEELFEVEMWSKDSIYPPSDYLWTLNNRAVYGGRFRDTVSGLNHIMCLTVEDHCASQICKSVDLQEGYFCQTSLDFYPTGSNNYEVAAQASGNGPFNYVWNNGVVGEDIIMYEQDGQQYLCATMMDAENCTAVHCSEVSFESGEIVYCINDFDFNFSKIEDQSSIHGTVEIVYTDVNGKSYYSRYIEQQDDIFDITNIEAYRNNAEGDPTLKFKLDLRCLLMSEDGEVLEFTDVMGVFALAGD